VKVEEVSQSCFVGIALLITSLINYAAVFTGVLFLVASATGETTVGIVVGFLGATFIMYILFFIPVVGPLIASGFGVYGALVLWEWPLTAVLIVFLWWPVTLLLAFLYDLLRCHL